MKYNYTITNDMNVIYAVINDNGIMEYYDTCSVDEFYKKVEKNNQYTLCKVSIATMENFASVEDEIVKYKKDVFSFATEKHATRRIKETFEIIRFYVEQYIDFVCLRANESEKEMVKNMLKKIHLEE